MKRIIAICTLLLATLFAMPVFAQAIPTDGQAVLITQANRAAGYGDVAIVYDVTQTVGIYHVQTAVLKPSPYCGSPGCLLRQAAPYFANRAAALAAFPLNPNYTVAVPVGQ
jgi:hypothetical protein